MLRFTARYWSGESRTFSAKNVAQAAYVAKGIAAKHGWVLKTVGKCA